VDPSPDLPALLNQAIAPFVQQLNATAEENGRLKEQIRQLEAQLSERAALALPADMSPQPPWWKRLLRKVQL
jgi:hypothetical protein